MGKGEITRYEQFLLFLQCFQKACFPGASKGVIVWEWVTLTLICRLQSILFWTGLKFCHLKELRKGENGIFSYYYIVSLLFQRQNTCIQFFIQIHKQSANDFNLDKFDFFSFFFFGKELLTLSQTTNFTPFQMKKFANQSSIPFFLTRENKLHDGRQYDIFL